MKHTLNKVDLKGTPSLCRCPFGKKIIHSPISRAQIVETSVKINDNSSLQNYTDPDNHTQQTTELKRFGWNPQV